MMCDDTSAWIREIIQATLPSLPEEKIYLLVEKLRMQGVESREDLMYVQEEDMVDFIRPIQCRKLLDCWKLKDSVSSVETPPRQLSTSATPVTSPSSSSSPMSSPLASPHTNVKNNWPETFQVNWNKMPPGLLSTITSGKRPSPSDRRQFVRVLVDDMRKYEANPTRAQCLIITRNITRQYPQSFADTLDDVKTMIGGGYESLLSQVKVRVEHLNRNNTLARHRVSKIATGATPARGPADSYGCTRWQPELPPEKTEESLEGLRQKMTDIYTHDGLAGAERGEIQKLMKATYYLQRKMINSTPAVPLEDIKSQWPYLFLPRSMCAHFELLTDIQILRVMEAFPEDKGRIIIEYFKANPSNDEVKKVLSLEKTSTFPYLLDLLMAHFKERRDALILHADVSVTAATAKASLALPDSPHLILLDPLTSDQRWMVSIEGQVVCEGASFVMGLAVVFTCFYNFNLQYQDEAACILEFIQRSCVGINPERGTKARHGKVTSKKSGKMVQKKVTSLNPHVCTLLRKLMDFEWDFV
ncbi:uncharacterized protein LOC121638641 [Melanotaenia boesemani]|uniref:uncharacterized protein LOC121638641 n=1 Tax=Melanotaenia boesemani TaxID=1250792 RepID=UPI001C053B29|nr:uncharacterized protein LOC121638641 [Melanotaenia boesemani]XP_041839468.1 uncharacterized protein LOC121638641 [Melanotaenia boesemani]